MRVLRRRGGVRARSAFARAAVREAAADVAGGRAESGATKKHWLGAILGAVWFACTLQVLADCRRGHGAAGAARRRLEAGRTLCAGARAD
ncbi:hypothetical protein FGB62_28g26 [Gracilaria domingensis]|nr:hypothetical protein FGB62_28g26 [Gracilaria domingensis]